MLRYFYQRVSHFVKCLCASSHMTIFFTILICSYSKLFVYFHSVTVTLHGINPTWPWSIVILINFLIQFINFCQKSMSIIICHLDVYFSFLVMSFSGFGIQWYSLCKVSWEVLPSLLFSGIIYASIIGVICSLSISKH